MNKPKTISLFVVCAAVLILSACGLVNGDRQKQPLEELMPLAVGNWWEYELTYLGSMKDTLRYEVVDKVQVPWADGSHTAYAFNLVPFPPGATEFYWLYRNGEVGVYLMGGVAETDTLFTNELDKWYPAEKGQTWEVPQLSFSRENLTFYVSDTLRITLIDDNRKIETPAGTFECYVYKFKIYFYEEEVIFTTWNYFMYYSPGIGLVAQISATEHEPEDIKEEMYLINYKIK